MMYDWDAVDKPLVRSFEDAEWQDSIIALMLQSDLVVIDVTRPTVNLLWELSRCTLVLPPHRVLLVGIRGLEWSRVMNLLREYVSETLPARQVELSKPIQYGGSLLSMLQFRCAFFCRMLTLARRDWQIVRNRTWEPIRADRNTSVAT
jgi:hypothetical protein